MRTTEENQLRNTTHRTVSIIAILSIIMMICTLVVIGAFNVHASTDEETNSLVLEVNMIPSGSNPTRRLSDTLSISIFETTTGDEYVIRTSTGTIRIPLLTDKHYFIYMSKTGSVTQFIEFQTTGSLNSQSRVFYADYDPVSLEDYDGYSMNYPMSVIGFSNDEYGTVQINNIGINVFYD